MVIAQLDIFNIPTRRRWEEATRLPPTDYMPLIWGALAVCLAVVVAWFLWRHRTQIVAAFRHAAVSLSTPPRMRE